MNKFWLIPIITLICLLFLGIGGQTDTLFFNKEPMNITDINVTSFEKPYTSGANLIVIANVVFNEDLEFINIEGNIHKKDGTYTPVMFSGNPSNGVANRAYTLNYTSLFSQSKEDIKNMDYLELTIKATNANGNQKEMKLNITQ